MKQRTYCQFCREELDLGSELNYQMDSEDFEPNEELLLVIRSLPDYRGEPLRICRECRAEVEQNRRDLEAEEAIYERRSRLAKRMFFSCFAGIVAFLLYASVRW